MRSAACMVGLALALHVSAPAYGTGTMRVGTGAIAETLDPPRMNDLDGLTQAAAIYDTLYGFDPLARPPVMVPIAAGALPEVSADYRTFVVRVRPGIYFSPHPSFEGRPRELVAADFAYAIRRVLDPKIRSTSWAMIEGKIEGLDELAQRAKDAGKGLDYDAPVAGLALVDRYTLRIRLTAPDPIFPILLTSPVFAAVAREVVEAEGDNYGHRPVGTGAFVVAAYTPGHRLTLVRNPQYRSVTWDELLSPASRAAYPDHPMRGRMLPALDRVEISSAPEGTSEVLALRRGELDLIPLAVPELAMRNGRLRDDFAREGIRLVRHQVNGTFVLVLNMRDPVVGGNAREKIALRRAIHMAFDDAEWIRVEGEIPTVRHQVVPPGIEGHVPGYRNPNLYSRAAANALLERFGYRRGADGFRRLPDGSALTVNVLLENMLKTRKRGEFVKRMLDPIGIRVAIETVAPAEALKRIANCHYGMAWTEWWLDFPDGTNAMMMFYGKAIGSSNMSCYDDPEFDAAYRKAQVMAPGPARTELFRTMQTRLDAFGPARPLPYGDIFMLKRAGVLGPFSTQTDWVQYTTLALDR